MSVYDCSSSITGVKYSDDVLEFIQSLGMTVQLLVKVSKDSIRYIRHQLQRKISKITKI